MCPWFILEFSEDPGLGAVCERVGAVSLSSLRAKGRWGPDPSPLPSASVTCYHRQAVGGPGRREARGAGRGCAGGGVGARVRRAGAVGRPATFPPAAIAVCGGAVGAEAELEGACLAAARPRGAPRPPSPPPPPPSPPPSPPPLPVPPPPQQPTWLRPGALEAAVESVPIVPARRRSGPGPWAPPPRDSRRARLPPSSACSPPASGSPGAVRRGGAGRRGPPPWSRSAGSCSPSVSRAWPRP